MLPLIALIWGLLLTNVAIADIDSDDLELQKILQEVEQNKSLYTQEVTDLVKHAQINANNFNEPLTELYGSSCSHSCKQEPINVEPIKPERQKEYLVFVSFSMPEATIKALYDEANRNNGVLLLRGLKNGSFKETAQALKSLEIGVQIDPEAFKKYKIEKVPTIVLVNDNGFKALSGNVTFQYAKEKLKETQ